MKIRIEYDVDTTSRYDYEPSFRTIRKVFDVDECDAEMYMQEKYSHLDDDEWEAKLADFDYEDEDFIEWVMKGYEEQDEW